MLIEKNINQSGISLLALECILLFNTTQIIEPLD